MFYKLYSAVKFLGIKTFLMVKKVSIVYYQLFCIEAFNKGIAGYICFVKSGGGAFLYSLWMSAVKVLYARLDILFFRAYDLYINPLLVVPHVATYDTILRSFCNFISVTWEPLCPSKATLGIFNLAVLLLGISLYCFYLSTFSVLPKNFLRQRSWELLIGGRFLLAGLSVGMAASSTTLGLSASPNDFAPAALAAVEGAGLYHPWCNPVMSNIILLNTQQAALDKGLAMTISDAEYIRQLDMISAQLEFMRDYHLKWYEAIKGTDPKWAYRSIPNAGALSPEDACNICDAYKNHSKWLGYFNKTAFILVGSIALLGAIVIYPR